MAFLGLGCGGVGTSRGLLSAVSLLTKAPRPGAGPPPHSLLTLTFIRVSPRPQGSSCADGIPLMMV